MEVGAVGDEEEMRGESEGKEIEEDSEEQLEEVVRLGGEIEKHRPDEEQRSVRRLVDPRLPSVREVKDHELKGHMPYRNWCSVCVRAKGKDLDHRADPAKERNVPEYSFDFAFPGDEFGHKTAVLVGKERMSGLVLAAAIPVKGSEGRYMLDKALEYMAEAGDMEGRIIIKSDQEPAVKRLVKDLVEARADGKSVVEESPVGSSGSNGVVERTVQAVEGQVRAILLALEDKLGAKVAAEEPIVTYIPDHAMYLINRLEVGKDGKTAYERVKGKVASVLGLEFGEKVLFMKAAKGKLMAKLRSKWDYGIFVGVRPRSNEIWVATAEKTWKVRSVRRLPEDVRWSWDTVRWVRRTMWNRFQGDEKADGDIPEGKAVEIQGEGMRDGQAPQGLTIITKRQAPREFYITKKDAEKHGYTRGCPGCGSWFRGVGKQPHTADCRERFRKLMSDDARVQLADQKRQRFAEQELERKKRREEKKEERGMKKKRDEENELEERHARSAADSDVEEEGKEGRKRRCQIGGSSDSGQGGPSLGGGVKRKMEDDPEGDQMKVDGEEIGEVEVQKWIGVMSAEGGQLEWDDSEDLFGGEGELDPKKVKEARLEEVQFMKDRGLWDVVPWPKEGCPVSVRWVDVLKGDGTTRSRLVARDFKGADRHRDDLFAATPPLEAVRAVLSMAATESSDGSVKKLMLIDAKKAHLNPRCKEDVYIELPAEVGAEAGQCGKLNFWLYGFRKAASAWEDFYAEVMEMAGFQRGVGCAVIFRHEEKGLVGVVHGDDFVFAGCGEGLKWVAKVLAAKFVIKVRAILGPEVDDQREEVLLGRSVRWRSWGIEWEADAKHRKLLLERFGLDGKAKALSVNGDWGDLDSADGGEQEVEVSPEEAKEFRAAVARLNYLGQDSPDVQFPAKVLSSEMVRPTAGSWRRLKKVVRFLVGRQRVVWRFPWQSAEEASVLKVITDADWGGDKRSRKSTSGGAAMRGRHCLRTWSTTQGAIALSTAEAELYAMVDGLLKMKGMKSMLVELGLANSDDVIELQVDSAAGKSFISRRGLGKMRHVELRDLWIQQEVGEGKVRVVKIDGKANPADVGTKFLSAAELAEKLAVLNLYLQFENDAR